MKKQIFILLAFAAIPFCYAKGNAPTELNKDEENIAKMVHDIRLMYTSQKKFHSLSVLPLKYLVQTTSTPITENDLKKFKLSTEEEENVAVITYKAKCANVKDIKEKFVEFGIIESSDYAKCKNNELVVKLNNT